MGLRSRGSVLLVGIWCLMTVVLANGYAGTLFSFLSVSKLEQPINSIEELANSKDVTLLTQSETELTDRFLVREFLYKSVLSNYFTYFFKHNLVNDDIRMLPKVQIR